jgi:hypothetical protein
VHEGDLARDNRHEIIEVLLLRKQDYNKDQVQDLMGQYQKEKQLFASWPRAASRLAEPNKILKSSKELWWNAPHHERRQVRTASQASSRVSVHKRVDN